MDIVIYIDNNYNEGKNPFVYKKIEMSNILLCTFMMYVYYKKKTVFACALFMFFSVYVSHVFKKKIRRINEKGLFIRNREIRR
jgi:hypothetical protein